MGPTLLHFRHYFSCFAVISIALAAIGASAAAETTLLFGGTGSATELTRQLGASFAASEPGVSIEVIPSLGSSGGIAAVIDGALDVAVSSRGLKPAESEADLAVLVLARTPFGMVSSVSDPGNIAAADLATFYTSTSSTWPDGTAVRVILRPKSESDTKLLGDMFPGMAEAIDQVRTRPEVPVAATDQDNAETAERIPGSLVATTLAQTVTEHRKLHFMRIDGVEPTLANLEAGTYPFEKQFHFVFAASPNPLVARFIDYMRSPEAVAVLRDAGSLPGAP